MPGILCVCWGGVGVNAWAEPMWQEKMRVPTLGGNALTTPCAGLFA